MNNRLIKSDIEIILMRDSGQLLSKVFEMLDDFICEGVSTMEIDEQVEEYIRDTLKARPASKGQYGYKYSINASPNEVVCHGIPDKNYRLKRTDIINIDITLEKNGYIADSSKMFALKDSSDEAKRLIKGAYDAMWKGINAVKPKATLGDIGYAIQKHAESLGYSVVHEYCGHGIGKQMHEDPQVVHYGKPNSGLVLEAGMIFTIEPMINQGKRNIKTKKDGWTVITRDGKLSAQWEHTILVTPFGYEVLTLRNDEKIAIKRKMQL